MHKPHLGGLVCGNMYHQAKSIPPRTFLVFFLLHALFYVSAGDKAPEKRGDSPLRCNLPGNNFTAHLGRVWHSNHGTALDQWLDRWLADRQIDTLAISPPKVPWSVMHRLARKHTLTGLMRTVFYLRSAVRPPQPHLVVCYVMVGLTPCWTVVIV